MIFRTQTSHCEHIIFLDAQLFRILLLFKALPGLGVTLESTRAHLPPSIFFFMIIIFCRFVKILFPIVCTVAAYRFCMKRILI